MFPLRKVESLAATFTWALILGCVVGHQARVENHCPFPIYLQSVQRPPTRQNPVYRIDPGQTYSENYKPVLDGTGVSIKISKMASTVVAPVTQFEYAFVPGQSPNLFYDLSDINDADPRQFCEFGLALYSSSAQCPTVVCPPNCAQFCSQVYNKFNDDYATKGCDDGPLTLILCTDDESVAS